MIHKSKPLNINIKHNIMQQPKKRKYNNIVPKTWWQKQFQRNIDYNQLLDRTIATNDPDPQIPTNKIQTSKYNYITFLPLNLIQQFTKPANIYFLFIGIMQCIPAISLSQGRPTIFIPLLIVVIASMVKDFIEDIQRRKSDKLQNQSQIQILTSIGFARRQWADIRVGNIIRVKKDHYFPCDTVLLDFNTQQKTAFIETKNLDGETNLKLRKICEHLQYLRQMPQLQLINVDLEFSFEKPNPFLSTFNGFVLNNDKKFILENSNLALRGCSLKINEWAIGLCVYTGHESKIFLNSGKRKRKLSKLQTYLNKYFIRIFMFQIGTTFIAALCYGVTFQLHGTSESYIYYDQNVVLATLITWGSWFISFSSFIPISLYITVEIVRYLQGKVLSKDQLCSSNNQFAQVQSSNLNQELGQVQYVLTDKTGTLTQNLMEFKQIYIDGEYFGTPKKYRQTSNKNSDYTERSLLSKNGRESLNEQSVKSFQKISNVDFPQSQKNKIVRLIKSQSHLGHKIRQALLHLSICHNVLVQKNEYSSSSPDELALVNFAKFIGYQFIQKNDEANLILIKQQLLPNDEEVFLTYKLLHILEFSSERKRMSVIVTDLNQEDHPIFLLTKGADDIILNRTISSQKDKDFNPELIKIQQALTTYASFGLRTLLLAQKQIDNFIYSQWSQKYNQALTTIGPERQDLIQRLQSNIEQGLYIVGATAIEDKLQSSVKQTIEQLKNSNIKVWMLTGDKKETATSIGYSTGLIDKQSQKITLDCSAQHANSLLSNLSSMMDMLKNKKVTIVSGQFIKKIDSQSRSMLQTILKQSQSVICCRVSPSDKQFVTKMVKKWGITLAIGDGANDVNMINSADVGIGVRGIEGSQATRAADFIITEFKLLRRLVLYHGTNFYHRNCQVMLYTLYKNMIITLPNLFYGPLSLFSAIYIYEIWVIQFYNIFFVSLPIFYYGVFDVLFSYSTIKKKPELYINGQKDKYFNYQILVIILLESSLLSFFVLYLVYYSSELVLCEKGLMVYEQWSGNLVMAVIVISCNVRVVLMSHQLSIVQGFLCLIGPLLYFLIFEVIGLIIPTDSSDTLSHQMSTGLYWILLISSVFIIQSTFVIRNTSTNIEKQIFQQKEKKKKYQNNLLRRTVVNNEQKPKDIELINDMIKEKNQIGGYAFAEDQNRNAIEVTIAYHKKIVPLEIQKS